MANALYDKGRESFLKGEIPIATDNIKAVLVLTGVAHYVVDLVNDQFLSAIAALDRIATSANFTTKTTAAGVFDADDITFPTVLAGVADGAVVLYDDTGVAGTSRLIAYIDTATGLPVTPSGGDIIVKWDNGANRIFKL